MQNNRLIQQNNQQKYGQTIQELSFQGHKIKIYGSIENPLFNCFEVVKVLGFKESNDNKFYKEHKQNSEFIVTLVVNQGDKPIKLFTESGLYKCLMKSNKPIAKLFQDEVSKFINNIRNQSLQQQIQEQQQQQQFIGELDKYKDMLSVQNFLFQDKQFNIYGTNDNPLFNCLDVIKVLGCTEANQNYFYQKNKNNQEFVKTLIIDQGDQQLGVTISHPLKPIKYFTESGIYECLFASDSQIAKQFRQEIIQLLKNIRLGVIGLQILNEQEYKRQIQEKEQVIQQQTNQISNLNNYIEENKEDIIIFDKHDVRRNRHYRRGCNNLRSCSNQHRYNSSNKHLRELYQNGEQVETKVLLRYRSLSKHDRRYAESMLIQQVPQKQRLNIVIPRYDANKVSEQCKQLVQQVLVQTEQQFQIDAQSNNSNDNSNNDLTTVQEEVKTGMCAVNNCDEVPCWGILTTKPTHCFVHKQEGMVKKHRCCIVDSCHTESRYCLPGTKKRVYCASHKQGETKRHNYRKCNQCQKEATYGILGQLPISCKQHIQDNFIDVKHYKQLCVVCKTTRRNKNYIDKCSKCYTQQTI